MGVNRSAITLGLTGSFFDIDIEYNVLDIELTLAAEGTRDGGSI
jgi:hypothetical protein